MNEMIEEEDDIYAHLWSLFYEMCDYVLAPEFRLKQSIDIMRETSEELKQFGKNSLSKNEVEKYYINFVKKWYNERSAQELLPMPDEWKDINNLSDIDFINSFIDKYKGVVEE